MARNGGRRFVAQFKIDLIMTISRLIEFDLTRIDRFLI